MCDEAERAGKDVPDYVVEEFQTGRLRLTAEDPDDPVNFPRVLLIWRANLFASSMKGHEYMPRHLLSTDDAVTATETPPELRPTEVTWREDAAMGKLDLSVAIDFRRRSGSRTTTGSRRATATGPWPAAR
ncbi:hypothetical protein ACKI1I_32380 [Streptomyces turgidiscabies]|uniref:hypothetical protein n=1 Tax=Streptomyces TaxID=1883 RepID=UPI0038F7ED6C